MPVVEAVEVLRGNAQQVGGDGGQRAVVGHDGGVLVPLKHLLQTGDGPFAYAGEALAALGEEAVPAVPHGLHDLRVLLFHGIEVHVLVTAHVLFHDLREGEDLHAPAGKADLRRFPGPEQGTGEAHGDGKVRHLVPHLGGLLPPEIRERVVGHAEQQAPAVAFGFAVTDQV